VLNHALDTGWVDGDVLVDDEHPAGAWALTLTGSYSDIARGLVAEAMKWGALPITLPPVQGGTRTRTYSGYDVAKVADRLDDLAKLADGDEIRFDPRIRPDGSLTFDLRSQPEIVDPRMARGRDAGRMACGPAGPAHRALISGRQGVGHDQSGVRDRRQARRQDRHGPG
jgi:hypothetical protein